MSIAFKVYILAPMSRDDPHSQILPEIGTLPFSLSSCRLAFIVFHLRFV